MRVYVAAAAAALLALGASPAWSQNPPQGMGPGGGGARRMEMLFRDIRLTPAQQATIDSIRARYRAQMPSFTPGTPPDSATRDKMRDLFRRQADEIRAVLTADQQKLWDRNVAEMRERRSGGP
jgi:Spy/CpxP family protein refolding chaperone